VKCAFLAEDAVLEGSSGPSSKTGGFLWTKARAFEELPAAGPCEVKVDSTAGSAVQKEVVDSCPLKFSGRPKVSKVEVGWLGSASSGVDNKGSTKRFVFCIFRKRGLSSNIT